MAIRLTVWENVRLISDTEVSVVNLQDTLDAIGVTSIGADEFADLLVDMFDAIYPAGVPLDMLLRPREAIEYCHLVQDRIEVCMPSHLILRTLVSAWRGDEKAGRIEGYELDEECN